MTQEDVRILVVDDEEANIVFASRLVETLPGVRAHGARSGQEALDMLTGQDFGIILLDILMPDMDGLETARRIRTIIQERTPPIIFLTALPKNEEIARLGFEAFSVDVLFKPIDPSILLAKVKIFVEQHRRRMHLEQNILENKKLSREREQLLAGARDILLIRDFAKAARSIYDRCKRLVGARAGYVALLTADGHENELVFLDSGDMRCTVDPSLPMPIRGLREVAYRECRTVYDNDFHSSRWKAFLPSGHCPMWNVLFAPLILEGKARGLLGLANKSGGFTDDDARIATTFAEFAAQSLHNSLILDKLRFSNHHLLHAQNSARMSSFNWNQDSALNFYSESLPSFLHAPFLDAPNLKDELRRYIIEGDRPQYDNAWRQALEGKSVGLNLRIEGDEKRIVHLVLSPSPTDVDGRSSICGTFQDLTTIATTQQQSLTQQNQLALGQMAASLAHEINTPLQYIGGNLEFLLSQCQESPPITGAQNEGTVAEIRDAITESLHGLKHISGIVQSMLRFSQHENQRRSLCDLNQIVMDSLVLASSQSDPQIAVETILSSNLPSVKCPKANIGHCILGLILNAMDALKVNNPKGKITIRTESVNGQVCVSVHDTGGGIPESCQNRIFQPFFTTKDVGQGLGMGLATIHTIVRSLGGDVSFSTKPGIETTFTIRLPSSDRETREDSYDA